METDLTQILRKIRLAITEYLNYEDAGVLLYDRNTRTYMAVSPNLKLEDVRDNCRLSEFYFNPEFSLVTNFLGSRKRSVVLQVPRESGIFVQGVDSLSPVSLLS
jgi:hypothetical protein